MRIDGEVAAKPAFTPWQDRGSDAGAAAGGSPRSRRDLDLLRGLARRINPQDAGAHNNLGVVFFNKGMYPEAVSHFERALELDPRMQVAERNLQICYFGTGHLESFTATLQQRLEDDPADEEARSELARTLFNSGDIEGAVRELRELQKASPRDPALYQRLAQAELKRGELDTALDALSRAEELDPGNARVQFMKGEALYQRGRILEALAPLERAIELDPQLADGYHLLAFVYGDTGEDEQAERMSARAAELNPSYSRAEAGLSLDSYSTARYEELIGSRGAAQQPAVAKGELAHYNLGMAFRQQALYDEALREFRLATERGENSYLVQQAEAEMLLLRGDGAAALELYQALLQQEPSSPKLWNEFGVTRHQVGALLEADEAYRRALEIDPHYALAWNNLAVVRHHSGNGDAEQAFRTAVREGRMLSDVWRNLGLMLHRTGRHADSMTAYERAIEEDPGSAQARTGLGMLLMELVRPDEARAQLLQAVELDPQLADARYHLAFTLSALGDYKGALRETKLALELNPYIPAPRFQLLIDLHFEQASVAAPELDAPDRVEGAAAVRSFDFRPESLNAVFVADEAASGDRQRGSVSSQATRVGADSSLSEARQALERGLLEHAAAAAQRAALQGASRMEVLLLQGEIFLRRGFSGEAVERFQAALAEIAKDSAGDQDEALRRALYGAARSLLDLNRMSQAVEAAERLCELAPGNAEALRTLGEALHRVSDFTRAALVLEQAHRSAPDDPLALTQLGAAYAAAGNPAAAETALVRAIEVDAMAVAARTALGGVLLAAGRDAEAETQYNEALRMLPSYGDAAFGLVELYEQRQDLKGAMNVLVELLSADPYRLDALVRLGDLLMRAGRAREARFAFQRVLRFDPHDEMARAGVCRAEELES
jgi:cellulose synthase operon protein C